MVGMVSFGTMSGMLSSGARIAAERAVGWNRQLRISPLSTRSYLRAKVLTAYMMALLTILVLYASGAALGVSLSAGKWLQMTRADPDRLIPFAALGIAVGHMLTPDSIGPAVGGGVGAAGVPRRHLVPDPQTAASSTTSASCCPPTGWCRPVTSRSAATPGPPRRGS